MPPSNNLPATTPAHALERAALSGYVRAISAEDMELSITEYRRIQVVLDKALPGQIMKIGPKMFRMKAYWRAVATAFNLAIDLVSTEILRSPDGVITDVIIVVKATAPNGRSAIGDGSCSMSEKTGAMRTLHNMHAHALTRATNRAISNLVGFGEVSAEEVDREGNEPDAVRAPEIGEIRQAIGAAIKRGWTLPAIRGVLDFCGATFERVNGTDRLVGMPEAERTACLARLTRDPPKVEAAPEAAKEQPKAEPEPNPEAGEDPWDREPSEEVAKPHDPSWAGVSTKWCASLKGVGLPAYATVAAWCEATGRKRPSAMTQAERADLWTAMTGPKRADLIAFGEQVG